MVAMDMTREELGGIRAEGCSGLGAMRPGGLEGAGHLALYLPPRPPANSRAPPRGVFLPLPNGLTNRVPVINLPLIKDAKLTSGS